MSDKMKEVMEKKQVKRKKEDKKYFVIMIILFVICGAGGYFFGRIMSNLQKSGFKFPEITDNFIATFAYIMPVVFVAINIILAIVAIVCIGKSRKELKIWDGEDEEAAEKIEDRVSIPLCMSNVTMIINMFLFAVCVNLDINSKFSEPKEDAILITNIIVFVLSFVVVFAVQKKCVDITKDMNPEKEGSIFDSNFSKKWENSCDEAQKLQIYKAGTAGFKAMTSVCMLLWIVCLIADLFAGVGLLPMTMVFIIWITGNIAYLVGGAKEEKKKKVVE